MILLAILEVSLREFFAQPYVKTAYTCIGFVAAFALIAWTTMAILLLFPAWY